MKLEERTFGTPCIYDNYLIINVYFGFYQPKVAVQIITIQSLHVEYITPADTKRFGSYLRPNAQ